PGVEQSQADSISQSLGSAPPQLRATSSPWATVATRLLQIHVAALYLMIALAQLAGGASSPWWSGQAVWMLVSRPEMPLVNMSWLAGHPFLIDFWTRFIVCVELAFPLLVWHRPLRPFVLAVAAFMWTGLALITGLTAFCLMMIVASLAFVPPQWLRAWWAADAETPAAATAIDAAEASASAAETSRQKHSHKS